MGLEALRVFPGNSEFSYLLGYSALARVRRGLHWGALLFSPELDLFREANGDLRAGSQILPLAEKGVSIAVPARLQLGDRWSLQGVASWAWRFYDQISEPGDIARTDLWIFLEVRPELRVGRGLSVFVEASEGINQSTLGQNTVLNKNFNQTKLWSGLVWEGLWP
jgi:hypothetical protein